MAPLTRSWFRRRLDTEPRRWVLFLAALEGLVALTLGLAGRGSLDDGYRLLIGAMFLTLAPLLGIVGLLVHGRLLLWAGRLLGGEARAHEIHAAFAWSQAPLAVASVPAALAVGVRTFLRVSGSESASDQVAVAMGPLTTVAQLAALPCAVLYVLYLAEAQGFPFWRSLVSQLLGAAIAAAIAAASAALVYLLFPKVPGGTAFAAMGAVALALAFAVEWGTGRLARRRGAV